VDRLGAGDGQRRYRWLLRKPDRRDQGYGCLGETQRTISETQEGIRSTQQELEQTATNLRKEAETGQTGQQDIDASAKSIATQVDGQIVAVNKTITDEIASVNKALMPISQL
jgi:hypothetical protein